MTVFIQLLFLFAFGASAGWLGEFAGRSIRAKRLINPGFLSGPALPIYGFGVVMLHYLSNLNFDFIAVGAWRVVFFTALVIIVMTLLEFVGGIIFIKGMKLKLWDYSRQPGNFMGIICPLFSALWGVCGLAYFYLINPWLKNLAALVAQSRAGILVIGLYYGVFLVDFAFSMKLGLKLRAAVQKLKTIINIQELQSDWRKRFVQQHRHSFFSLQFKINALLGDIRDNRGDKPIIKYLYEKYGKKDTRPPSDKKDDADND
jgi:uncharacterized membrane protein